MFSRPLAFVLLALGCVTAAAGGAYVANRHNTAEVAVSTEAAPAVATAPGTPTGDTGQTPVAETEAAVSGATSNPPATLKAEKAEAAPAIVARRPEAAAPKSAPFSRRPPAIAGTSRRRAGRLRWLAQRPSRRRR